jgi:hypothetical protein
MCNLMKTRIIILIVLIISAFSCADRNEKPKRQNEIHKINFATGGCYGHCPIQAFSIDSSLNIKYHGIKYTDNNGYFVGSVSQSFWDTLNSKLEHIKYKQLDTLYRYSVDDLSTIISIYYKDGTKKIRGQSASLPDSVMMIYNWLMGLVKQFNLKQTNDTVQFESFLQKPTVIEPIVPPPTIVNE